MWPAEVEAEHQNSEETVVVDTGEEQAAVSWHVIKKTTVSIIYEMQLQKLFFFFSKIVLFWSICENCNFDLIQLLIY